jgi:hypothetical protein
MSTTIYETEKRPTESRQAAVTRQQGWSRLALNTTLRLQGTTTWSCWTSFLADRMRRAANFPYR